ncbi:DUF6626 family protein [Skermanella stibiiresistens]|uniref:DUF6626 family protein n=1 Tax=Skermanella stibiiresistens TaxID=913326 RepID=UPI0012F9C47C|nr:DUF6626 family protein [Skermanella stibiiresistens]
MRFALETLKALKITSNNSTFSRDFLGYSPRYYDYLTCSGAQPSINALTALAVRINRIANALETCPKSQEDAKTLGLLRDQLWAEVERRSIIRLPVLRQRRTTGNKVRDVHSVDGMVRDGIGG